MYKGKKSYFVKALKLGRCSSQTFFAVIMPPLRAIYLLTTQTSRLGKPREVIPMTRKTENIHRGKQQYFNLPSRVIPKG